ncbi:inositol monophosphatase family protein [Nonomuraea sp. NPDC050663]|uniref:inositol monophosphatase family protein n=1 Tax=Nonomuraea sp. NPDC050663 TaxID=3364370 RepID=UPI0037BA85D5
MDQVPEILREAAEQAIIPRFRALSGGDVSEKSPGELVTVADREAEALIAPRLRALLDVPVVGEEASSDTPGLRAALHDTAWLVDPLDGTSNFIAGSPDFAVMAALVRNGRTVAGWILRPLLDAARLTGWQVYAAELGGGAWRDGERIWREPARPPLGGAALTRFFDPEARARLAAAEVHFKRLTPGAKCAGVDYPRVVDGEQDFVLFHRTLPWDHAPGTLLVSEAGGMVARPGGAAYRPAEEGVGLLAAADAASWKRVAALVF